MPGASVHGILHGILPDLHYLPKFAQIHVHCVDAIQPYLPAPHSSPPDLNLSQHQGFFFPKSWLFAADGQSIGASTLASVLPKNIQG